MIFKVYANNVRVPQGMRIKEATKEDYDEAVKDVFRSADDSGLIDYVNADDEIDFQKMEVLYDKIHAYFDENKVLEAGDYMIIETESANDITVPNMCGNDASIIF